MQSACEYSHNGPIRRRECGNILTTDQSDAGSAGTFGLPKGLLARCKCVSSPHARSCRQTPRYTLTSDQSDAGSV
eukprot:5407857-Pyramimonas_sp.AAC.1